MKKLIAIVLTIALFTCLFAGCSSKTTDQPATQPAADAAQTQSTSESTSSETTTSSESGEFTLYAWGDAHWNEYVQVQDLFNSLYPDYKMTYMQENSLTDLLITKAAQNALPDMFYAEPYVRVSEWAEGGWLTDLSNEDWVKNIPQNILDSVSYDGKVYAFPYSVCYTGFFYNMDIFEELGLSVPTTVSEFRTVCETLAAAGYTPIAVGGGGSAGWVYYQMWNSLIGAALGDDAVDFANKMNAGETSFADVPNIDKIGEMLQMSLVDYNVASPLDADYSSMITSFATGKAAMYHNGSWSTGDVLGMNPDMNLGFFGYPVSENPDDVRITYEVEIAIPITTNSKSPEACRALLNFYADADTGAAEIAKQSRIPVTDVEMDSAIVGNAYTDAMAYVSNSKTTAWLNWLSPTGFNDDFASDIQNFVMGTTSFDQLVQIADAKWASYAAN